MTFFLITASLFVLAGIQARLPTQWWAGGLRFEFLPALVVFGALTFRHRAWALVLALAAGFAQDSLSAGPFGATAVAYSAVALILTGMARSFDREALWMQMLGGALASALGSGAALWKIGVTGNALTKALLLAVVSAVVTPLLFGVLDALRRRPRRL